MKRSEIRQTSINLYVLYNNTTATAITDWLKIFVPGKILLAVSYNVSCHIHDPISYRCSTGMTENNNDKNGVLLCHLHCDSCCDFPAPIHLTNLLNFQF